MASLAHNTQYWHLYLEIYIGNNPQVKLLSCIKYSSLKQWSKYIGETGETYRPKGLITCLKLSEPFTKWWGSFINEELQICLKPMKLGEEILVPLETN